MRLSRRTRSRAARSRQAIRKNTTRSSYSRRLSFEPLEDRLALAVFTVTTGADTVDAGDGQLSLREAILAANSGSGTDTIHFSGVSLIALTSELPEISDSVIIDGQSGVVPGVRIDGGSIGGPANGLTFTHGFNTVRGLVISRFEGAGMTFANSDFNIIQGNYIGTNLSGTIAQGNFFDGIEIINGSFNTIGGVLAKDRNIIVASQIFGGIYIANSTDNDILGNYIGVAANGVTVLRNHAEGIYFHNVANSFIGGIANGERNVISGNGTNGIVLAGNGSTNNDILGNYIGTDASGAAAVPNGVAGVLLTNSGNNPADAAHDNRIGGMVAGAGNVISGNTRNGIELYSGAHHNKVRGNYIGTTANGLNRLGNGGNGSDPFGGYGIDVDRSPNNIIGGDDDDDGLADGIVAARNVISGNAVGGVWIEGAGTTGTSVAGNLIGLNALGLSPIANAVTGILIDGVSNNTIGGSTSGAGNTISGNGGDGVDIKNGATNNKVRGNRIGTNVGGFAAVPNHGNGVFIYQSPNNSIGDYTATPGTLPGNLISGNLGSGIQINGLASALNSVYGNIVGLDTAGVLKLPNQGDGIYIQDAPSNTIGAGAIEDLLGRNVVSGNAFNGVRITGANATGNFLVANWIGTAATGGTALGNSGSGVGIEHAPANTIDNNVISGNETHGLEVGGTEASANIVQRNRIGLDSAGSIAVGNQQNGIWINGAKDTLIGDGILQSGFGNKISANLGNGIEITGGVNATGNLIHGNTIGAAADGTTDRGNAKNGIKITDGYDNWIGGPDANHPNLIAFNGSALNLHGHGVLIVSGTGNRIRRNSIHSNHGRGIDLGNDSFTLNDVVDIDGGANSLQNFPVVRKVEFNGGSQTIYFSLNSKPNTSFTWDFYSNTEPDPSGYGEGRTYLESFTNIDTNNIGNSGVIITRSITNLYISATVTDPAGNTSEFSMVDTDADGLADAWEPFGIDADENGVTDLFLYGADSRKKDIFVEVDAMVSRNPDTAALNDVVAAFAIAPANSVQNPDGSDGITLHWFLGGDWGIDLAQWYELDDLKWPRGFDLTKNGEFYGDHTDGTFGLPSDRSGDNWSNIRTARFLATRYAVFADQFGTKGNSGLAEVGGNDLMVTLGLWDIPGGTRTQQAATFMHELGHTLGLEHGGGDDVNHKPNYFSVMNYTWQFPHEGYDDSWVMDFSRHESPTINEASVNEFAGLGGDPFLLVPIGPAVDVNNDHYLGAQIVPQGGAFDLNFDGVISNSVPIDLTFINDTNGDLTTDILDITPHEVLSGFDDWKNLTLNHDSGRPTGNADDLTFSTFLQLNSFGIGPGLIQFSNSVYRNEENKSEATITVVRAGGTDGPVSVQYRTIAGGSALIGTDYTTTNGTLNFADHEYLKTFTISITDDSNLEGTETVLLQLFSPSGTTLGSRSTATLQVVEPMFVRFVDGSTLDVGEGDGTISIGLVLNGETGQTLSGNIVVRIEDLLAGTAQSGIHYALPAVASVMFPAGSIVGATQSIALQVLDNEDKGPPRTVTLDLKPIESLAAVSDSVGLTLRILDDDLGAPVEYGDFSGDSHVDAADYILWHKNSNTTVDEFTQGDANGNSFVDQEDYNIWRTNFGLTIPSFGSGATAVTSSMASPAGASILHTPNINDSGEVSTSEVNSPMNANAAPAEPLASARDVVFAGLTPARDFTNWSVHSKSKRFISAFDTRKASQYVEAHLLLDLAIREQDTSIDHDQWEDNFAIDFTSSENLESRLVETPLSLLNPFKKAILPNEQC